MLVSSPIAFFGEHYPDGHAQTLRRHFGRRAAPEADVLALREALSRLKLLYVVCFTSRSGSHFLGQVMASDGRLKRPGETLNADVVLRHVKEQGLHSHEGYLAWMLARAGGRQGIAGVKASAGQLIALYNAGVLTTMGDRLRLIHLVREDTLDQAISLHIAAKTRQWTSLLRLSAKAPGYNAARLLQIASELSAQNSAFRTLFQLWGLTPLVVHYERLLSDPGLRIQRVGRFLGLPDLAYVPEQVSCERQSGPLNAEFKARLQQDFSLALQQGVPAPGGELASGSEDAAP